jgi:ABC-2 type transport system ATP-binding protein
MLEIKNVTHNYGKFRALNDLSFTINDGAFVGLIGPNGAGKTTLLNILNGILAPTEGEVLLDGDKVSGFNPKVRFKLGYMPSELDTYEMFSPLELLNFLSAMYSVPEDETKEKIAYLFDKLEMNDWRNKSIKKLSTGMKKKTAFAASIIHNPSMLILDEPFESVDPISQHTMRQILKDLTDNGCSIIMSSHILDQVQSVCSQYIILNKGEVIKTFDKADLGDSSLEQEFIDIVEKLKLSEETGEDDLDATDED